MSRRKRIRKGLDSVRRQIEAHQEKQRKAEMEGNLIGAKYWEKETEQLRNDQRKRERLLSKKKRKKP